MKQKVIVYFDENRNISGMDGYIDDEQTPPRNENYKVFVYDDTVGLGFCDGTCIDYYDDTTTMRHTDKYLVEKGIRKLLQTEILDSDTIREKTKLEQYESGVISKDEYNSLIKEQRTNEYYNQTDKINSQIRNDTDMSDNEKVELEAKIETLKAEIKEQYPYVD